MRSGDFTHGLKSVNTDLFIALLNKHLRLQGVLAAIGIALDGVFDTLEASRRARGVDALGGHSLAMVCERELGISLDKSPRRPPTGAAARSTPTS